VYHKVEKFVDSNTKHYYWIDGNRELVLKEQKSERISLIYIDKPTDLAIKQERVDNAIKEIGKDVQKYQKAIDNL